MVFTPIDTLPARMTFSTLELTRHDGGLVVVTINRPQSLNALNATVIDELDACFEALEKETELRGVVLTGSGEKAFVAGADITQFTELNQNSGKAFAERGQAVFNRIENFPRPVIAAVNGFALGGGCELALACHLRMAAETARFGQPEVNLGILPGYGGSQRLPRIVGKGIAVEMILTGEMISAARAYEIGLVNKVTPPDELLGAAVAKLKVIASKGPIAVTLSLKALRYADDLSLTDGLLREAELFGEACATEDLKEGATAFLEKRAPHFSGN
jgi:enoyl-CoA hydratase